MSDMQILLEAVEAEMEVARNALSHGQIGSMEDFRFMRGQFWALRVVQDMIKARIQQHEES